MLPEGHNFQLSPRELTVACMAAKTALTGQQMADKMFVDIKTIKFHLTSIYKKMNVKSRAELLHSYYTKGHVYDVLENAKAEAWL